MSVVLRKSQSPELTQYIHPENIGLLSFKALEYTPSPPSISFTLAPCLHYRVITLINLPFMGLVAKN